MIPSLLPSCFILGSTEGKFRPAKYYSSISSLRSNLSGTSELHGASVFVFPNMSEPCPYLDYPMFDLATLSFYSYDSNYLYSRSIDVSSVCEHRRSYPLASTRRGFGCRMLVLILLCLLVRTTYYSCRLQTFLFCLNRIVVVFLCGVYKLST